MTIFRADLEPPEAHFIFKDEKLRDRFVGACQNIAKGNPWDAAVQDSWGRPRSARKSGPKSRTGDGGEAGADERLSASGDGLRDSMSSEAGRPPEDGSGASDVGWDAEGDLSLQSFCAHPSNHKIMCVLINDTERELNFVGEYAEAGNWYRRPPKTIAPLSTATWAVVGTSGSWKDTGPAGCLVYSSDGISGSPGIELILAYDNPARVGYQKAGGAVLTKGAVRMRDGASPDPHALKSIFKTLTPTDAVIQTPGDVHM